MNIKGNQVPSSKCITEKTYFNPIDTQSNYRASIMFHYAVYSSIRMQNICIINYSNDCWEKDRSFSIFKKYWDSEVTGDRKRAKTYFWQSFRSLVKRKHSALLEKQIKLHLFSDDSAMDS